jgi:hypothetical protein
MKTKLSTIFLVTGIIFLTAQNNVRAQKKAPKKNAVVTLLSGGAVPMLKNFYASYIGQYTIKDPKTIEKNFIYLRKEYCTKNLLAKIDKADKAGELHNDPFTKAQNGDVSSLKTLSIVKGGDKYIVSYIYPGDKSKKTINLTVVKEGDNYKINSVDNL